MAIKTISQLRLDNPTATPHADDLVMVDKTDKTVSYTMQQVKDFVKPGEATTTDAGLLSSTDKNKLDGVATGATRNSDDAYLLNRANHTGQISIGDIQGLGTSVTGKESRPTGVLAGMLVKVGDTQDKITIEAGTACFATYTDPANPSVAVSAVEAKTNITLAHLTTSNITYIGLQADGNLVQQTTPFTPNQIRGVVRLAIVLHPSRTKVDHIITQNRPTGGAYNNVQDMADYMGVLPKGIHYSGNEDMSLSRTAGTLYSLNSTQSRISVTKQAKVKLRYRDADGVLSGNETQTIKTDTLLDGTPANDGKWQVQPVYLMVDGGTAIFASEKEYDTCTAALAAYNDYKPTGGDFAYGVYVGSVIVKKAATGLLDASMGLFVTPDSITITKLLVSENLSFDPDTKADKDLPIEVATVSTLPEPATHENQLRLVTDASGGAKLCYCTGTQWNIINTTTKVE